MWGNLGRAAGAASSSICIHVVPRWNGDTNFMPVAGTSVCAALRTWPPACGRLAEGGPCTCLPAGPA
jgi:diadenosine tetraphosphate (Ap4A) HIT family hydrolase